MIKVETQQNDALIYYYAFKSHKKCLRKALTIDGLQQKKNSLPINLLKSFKFKKESSVKRVRLILLVVIDTQIDLEV